MLPAFPNFKKLELSDKADVEAITSKYPPYSDFNFTSMWCWDIKGEMKLSELNGNLVVRFTDYITGEPFYSFLGSNNVNKTAQDIIKLSIQEDLGPELRLLPEISTIGLDGEDFNVIEDRDNFDYIYSIEALSLYKNNGYSTKRNLVNRLIRSYPQISVSILDLSSLEVREKILELSKKWEDGKAGKAKSVDFKNESSALERFFTLGEERKFIGVGVFCESTMMSFCINEVLPSEYVIAHFAKADDSSSGIYAYLMRETARNLLKEKRAFLNYEQDLGMPNLRYSKNSFRPGTFLKKYILIPLMDLEEPSGL